MTWGNISTMKKLTELATSTRRLWPHAGITLLFAVIALGFYYPLLSGNQLLQSDIVQYQGMGRQLVETREKANREAYWIDNAFGGMPTYQLGAQYPADFLTPLHQMVRILPRPAHLLFLYLFSFYLFLLVLRLPWHTALFGALAYGFSTYMLIIIQVGHNSKALALAYMPLVFAGVLLLFREKKVWGFVLTTLALALQLRANHYQMTYYMLLLLGVLLAFQIYDAFKTKKVKALGWPLGLLCSAGLLALGLNATPLLATAEYTSFSTRGATELQLQADGSPQEGGSGLDYDYITEYSYGIFESLNLIVPRIQGGGSRENLGQQSDLYDFLIRQGVSKGQADAFIENVPTYWGQQPILEAPAYVGITVFLLALFGVFMGKGRLRYGLVAGFLLSLFLSWGKNFPLLTQFFIDYVPLYTKFRAVSSIQVILEFCLPVLAALGLHALLQSDKKSMPKLLRFGGGLSGVLLLLLLSKGMFTFTGAADAYLREGYGEVLFAELVAARKIVFTQDLTRAILFCLFLLAGVAGYWYKKISRTAFIAGMLALLLFDLLGISQRYIDRDLFVSGARMAQPFKPTSADRIVQQDSTHYRVYEPRLGLTGGRTAYFHNALGGYHGAKPRRFEELFQYFTTHNITGVLNMLNVKYVLSEDETGLQPLRNPDALGPAWFVDTLRVANSADAALEQLKTLDFKTTAVAIENEISLAIPKTYPADSAATIVLKTVTPGLLEYETKSATARFAVFSEMYYPKGWTLTIDGAAASIYPVNYVLRGAYIPEGTHVVRMEFNPPVVAIGTGIRRAALALFIFLSGGLFYRQSRKA